MLLGKIKIHEIAKNLNLTSKEVLEIANTLKIEAKSHMSGVTEEEAKKIEENFTQKQNKEKKEKKNMPNKEDKKKEAKKDERHKKSGKLLYFLYEGEKWPLQPKTAFYDYIYMKAVLQCFKREEIEKLFFYDWFTDIEFNPKKSINCQARSVTILTYIMKHHLENTLNAKQDWIAFHKQIVKG